MKRIALFTVIGIIVPSFAYAATLYTAPIRVGLDDRLQCAIVNVGTRAIVVEIESHLTLDVGHPNGPFEQVLAGSPVTLGPGEVTANRQINDSAPAGSSVEGWCKFTFTGSKRRVRAGACQLEGLGFLCRAAMPAQ